MHFYGGFCWQHSNSNYCYEMRKEEKMKDWIVHQITDINILTIVIMIFFVTTMSKANTNKLLKQQSSEIYNDIEEIKDEIWRAAGSNNK